MIKKFILSLAISAVLHLNTAYAVPAQSDYLQQGQAAIEAGRVYDAIELLQQAERQNNKLTESWLISIALADALLRNGQIEAADEKLQVTYQKVIDNPAILSEIMLRFGHISAIRGHSEKAKDWYQQALQSAKQRNDHAQMAVALIDLSKVSADSSLLRQADEHIQQLNDPELQQQLLISLAYQSAQQGQIQMAHQTLQSVLLKPVNTRLKSQALGQMGELYALQQRYEEALQLTDQALLSDESADLQLQWTWQRARLLVAKNQLDQASLLVAKNQWDQDHLLAVKKQMDQVLVVYRSAAQQLERLRIDIPVVYHNGKSSFNQTFSPLYTDFIAILLQQAELVGAVQQQQILSEVVQTWELLKTVELQDYFRNACAIKQRPKILALEVGTAMLYPMLLSDHLALVVRFSDHIKAYSVPHHPEKISELVRHVSKTIYMGKPILNDSQTLYQWLIAPVAADLQQHKVQTLVYLPDGVLRKIPFALLHDGQQYLAEQYALVTVPGLSLLADRSAEVNKMDILLAGMSKAGPVVEELMSSSLNLFGAPTEEQRSLVKALQPRGLGIVDFESEKIKERGGKRIVQLRQKLALPGVSIELESLSKISEVPVMENASFLRENFQQSIHQGHAMVHIASHGFFSGDPEKSFIMTYDHLLNMQQLAELFQNEAFHDRQVEMVTLSACQTAEGDDRSPLGLSGVVVQAGVKSAIGTLWPVADKAAQQFFSDFYKLYQQPGMTKAKAMQQAQRKLLKNGEIDHPLYWAPFVLVGEWH